MKERFKTSVIVFNQNALLFPCHAALVEIVPSSGNGCRQENKLARTDPYLSHCPRDNESSYSKIQPQGEQVLICGEFYPSKHPPKHQIIFNA